MIKERVPKGPAPKFHELYMTPKPTGIPIELQYRASSAFLL